LARRVDDNWEDRNLNIKKALSFSEGSATLLELTRCKSRIAAAAFLIGPSLKLKIMFPLTQFPRVA